MQRKGSKGSLSEKGCTMFREAISYLKCSEKPPEEEGIGKRGGQYYCTMF